MVPTPDPETEILPDAPGWWREWEFWVLVALVAAIYFSRIADLLEVEVGQVALPGSVQLRTISVGELAQMNHVLLR